MLCEQMANPYALARLVSVERWIRKPGRRTIRHWERRRRILTDALACPDSADVGEGIVVQGLFGGRESALRRSAAGVVYAGENRRAHRETRLRLGGIVGDTLSD